MGLQLPMPEVIDDFMVAAKSNAKVERSRHRFVAGMFERGRDVSEIKTGLIESGVPEHQLDRYLEPRIVDVGFMRVENPGVFNDPQKYPPFPPGGGGGPAGTGVGVGGVSLDKVAEVLVNLNDITGAAFDQNSGQLILMGKRDSGLPPMNLDDLAVAIRCIYGAEDPGVSIDPVDPSSQDGRMVTTYICPHVENTHFGLVMAEADLYLKSASIGKDNETGEPLTSNVACYRSELDWMLVSERQGSDPRWHRMWFLPREIKVVPSPDGNSMRFDRTTIEVQARFVEFDAAGQKHDVPGSDPAIDAFVRCLTDQYDEFALEREELQELKQLAQIVGVVKWLRDKNIPVDLSWVERYEVTRVSTPTAVKGIHVTAERPVAGGTRILSLYGGVDFSEENTYAAPSDNVHALAQTAVSARPNAAVLTWNFDHDGDNLTAVALNLSKSKIVGGYSDRQTDIALPIRGNLDVNFTRFYNSLDIVDGPLGLGWSPFPFELNIQQVPRKASPERFLIESEVSLFDAARQKVEMFEGPFKESNTGRILYLPKCTACGYIDLTEQPGGDYILLLQDRSMVVFNGKGRLSGFADDNGNRVDYRFREGLLVEIGVLDGPTLRLDYNGQGRVIQIEASDERKVKYDYDTVGRLTSVTQANGSTTTYEYDSEHHLTKVADTSQRTLITNTYDGLGRLLEQTGCQGYAVVVDYDQAGRQAVYSDDRGHRLVRTYDEQQRLAEETDSLGETVTFAYDTIGRVTSVTDKLSQPTTYKYDQFGNVTQITGPLNTVLQFGYDANRNLSYFIDEKQELTLYEYDGRNNLTRITHGLKVTEWDSGRPRQFEASQAQSREFRYNPDGTVAVVTEPSGQETEFGYDAEGNVVSIRAGQVEVRQEFDTHSRLTKVFYGQGQSTSLEYDNRDLLTGISTAAGNLQYEYDSAGNLVEATDVNGLATSYAYDDSNNLVRLIEATGAEIRYKYDPDGNLIEVIDANDRRTTFEYDLLGRVTRQSIAISEITPNP